MFDVSNLKMKPTLCIFGRFATLNLAALAQPTNAMNTNKIELATFGGGCFWCMEAVFERLPGVKSVTSGFAGGHTANPTYEQVCTGATGHAEVTQIEFDPAKISYEKLLDVFWQAHDPTTLNRQGADEGTQYRSIILYHSEAQELAAEKSKAAAQKISTSHRHRNCAVYEILQSRGLPSGILQQQFQRALLPGGDHAETGEAEKGKDNSKSRKPPE